MDIRLLRTPEELSAYDRWVKGHPQGTLWQSLEWKEYQEALGRQVRVYAALEDSRIAASALVVIDRTAFGLSVWEMPRGPLGEGTAVHELLEHIEREARHERCLALFLSPIPSFSISNFAFPIRASARHQQPEATRILDLTLSEDLLLAQMHPKGRYNIRVAQKHGVRVERSDDVGAFYGLLQQTGDRDGFGILPKRHYEAFLSHLKESFLLLAYAPPPGGEEAGGGGGDRKATAAIVKDIPLAGLLGTTWNNRGIYYYGASDYRQRALMAPYLLQWEAMQHCKAHGCASYDLLGIAPPDAPANHPWAGVSGFKEKFGGTVVTYPPERQMTLRPVLNALLQAKRKILG